MVFKLKLCFIPVLFIVAISLFKILLHSEFHNICVYITVFHVFMYISLTFTPLYALIHSNFPVVYELQLSW